MPRRKKPDFEKASSALESLAATPRVKQKTPLELAIEKDFDNLLKAFNQGYSLSEICTILSQYGIRSTPKLLKQALYEFAKASNRIAELPEKLIPEGEGSESTPELEAETGDFEKVIDQNFSSEIDKADSQSKKSRFNTVELKFDEVAK